MVVKKNHFDMSDVRISPPPFSFCSILSLFRFLSLSLFFSQTHSYNAFFNSFSVFRTCIALLISIKDDVREKRRAERKANDTIIKKYFFLIKKLFSLSAVGLDVCAHAEGKDKGLFFYSFIYKSDTPSTIATHRSICTDCKTSFLTYIKICADTFDNKYLHLYYVFLIRWKDNDQKVKGESQLAYVFK